ncbi:MAG: hypothetical protein EBR40_11460 [Proteobacteria bacterium]|nr:hypothetical protein [Pseudomonadota bacterium]
MKEICAEVNTYRRKMGYKPLSAGKIYKIREMAAEAFLSLYPDGNTGLVRNPYIANRMVGRAYLFSADRAAKLVRLGVRYKQPPGAGRRIGLRLKRRRKVAV